jgi:hypothetical protein
MLREKSKWEDPMEDESTKAGHRGGVTRSSEEGPVMGLEQRGGIVQLYKHGQPIEGGVLFVVFSPAVSPKATKAIRQTIREWRLRSRVGQSLEELAYWMNPVIRGWIQYYSRFRPSAFSFPLQYLNLVLVRWVQRKYKRLRSWRRASRWLRRIARREPRLFAHWRFVRP